MSVQHADIFRTNQIRRFVLFLHMFVLLFRTNQIRMICPLLNTFVVLLLLFSVFLLLFLQFIQSIDNRYRFIRYLSWVELEPVSTQLQLGLSEMNLDTELIDRDR